MMETQNTMPPVQPVPQPAPPPAQPDGRAPADAVATTKEPTPEIPMPTPATQSQTGLVNRAALSDKDASPKMDTTGTSAAERTLKPYGISMLPDTADGSPQPSDTATKEE